MRLRLARIALRYLRTVRYIADLLVWSRVFVARRTLANIQINDELRAKKAVAYRQPALAVGGRTGAQHFEHGFSIVYDVLFANLQMPSHNVHLRHALPGPAFAGVYLWDSAFIALIWRDWDTEVAYDVLESVIALRRGDQLQHVVQDFVRSEFTQPPLIAWAAMRLHSQRSGSLARLARFYEALHAYHRWLDRHRRLDNGLYFWMHPYESGVENSPRFSSRDESRLADTTMLAAPDFSAYMVLQCEALSAMATALGHPDAAARHANEAVRIRDLIEALLWHEEDGLYYDLNVRTGRFVRSRTIASLIPLAAGVPGEARAARMRGLLCNASAFGSTIPFPSVALDDPSFEKDMWRGPVWINTAYLVLDGLLRYGYEREYAQLAWRLCDGVYRVLEHEHQIYEFYDPEYFHTRELRRKKGNWWKAFTLGTRPQKDFVGWSGLVNPLLIEGLIGYRRTAAGCVIRPRFPDEARGLSFRLSLPQDDCQLELSVLPDGRVRGRIEHAGRADPFELAAGEAHPMPAQAAGAARS
ncbi:MAG: trehalase family glycosidase [Pseudomonadota bacterium]